MMVCIIFDPLTRSWLMKTVLPWYNALAVFSSSFSETLGITAAALLAQDLPPHKLIILDKGFKFFVQLQDL